MFNNRKQEVVVVLLLLHATTITSTSSLPETNIFTPKNGWLEYNPFLLGFGLFSGAKNVSFREGTSTSSTTDEDIFFRKYWRYSNNTIHE